MTLYRIAPVTEEPVTLGEAATMLRIDGNDLGEDLASALKAARSEAEHFTGRSLAPQQWRLTLRDWWLGGLSLPRGPVNGVASIAYRDAAGNWQTIDPSLIVRVEDPDSEPVPLPEGAFMSIDDELVAPFYSTPPRTANRDGAVRIVYNTGAWAQDSDGSHLPDDIKRAIVMLAQSTFDSLAEQPHTLRERAYSLLRPFRYDTGMVAA